MRIRTDTSTMKFAFAIHESGHAIACRELEIPVTRITLASSRSFCEYDDKFAKLEDLAAATLAGVTAEKRILGRVLPGNEDDMALLDSLALTSVALRSAQRKASRIVNRCRDDIVKLAKALDFAEEIQGDNLRKIWL